MQEVYFYFHFSPVVIVGYNKIMEYEFSLTWFFIGFIVLAVGVLFVRFHQWVADNFGAGVGSYERYKLYALLTCVLGLVVMVNLHSLILGWFFGMLFNRGSA
jgi:uncharacterized membrane-anchored protein YitT (DUF2179 family)